MTVTGLQLRSLVKEDATLELSLQEMDFPVPGADEVTVRVEAAPINPSDLGVLVFPGDVSTIKATGSAERPVVTMDIPKHFMPAVGARLGQSMPVGNEGSGTVIAAGESEAAQALMGKMVGMIGGDMFGEYRTLHIAQIIEMEEGTTAEQAASCFVNPMTALGMVETMRSEGHTALVHTAAASNLGQMLNRVCIDDGVELVNIVRKPEQEALLRDLGAKHIVNSESDDFLKDLTSALTETGATIAFDAIGGGKLATNILSCMEAAASKDAAFSRYGSDTHKQVYIYGGLDMAPTVINRSFGFSWGVGGWLLFPFLQKTEKLVILNMRKRVSKEIATTFASHYSQRISLTEALSPEIIQAYDKKATGEKFLIVTEPVQGK